MKTMQKANESFESLKNNQKVHLFWSCTNMQPDEFRALVSGKLQTKTFDVFNDFTEGLVCELMKDFVERAEQMSPQCGEVVKSNYEEFLKNPNSEKMERNKEMVKNFVTALSNFYHDEPLALSLLLNFIRSILRNDFIRRDAAIRQVDLRQGVTERIWENAYHKYFPENAEK